MFFQPISFLKNTHFFFQTEGAVAYMYLKLSQSFEFSCCFSKTPVPWRGWGAEEVKEVTEEFLLSLRTLGYARNVAARR